MKFPASSFRSGSNRALTRAAILRPKSGSLLPRSYYAICAVWCRGRTSCRRLASTKLPPRSWTVLRNLHRQGTCERMNIEPVTLEGQYVLLEPLSLSHHAQLCEVGLDEEIWRWVSTAVKTPDDLHKYIETAIDLREQGSALPFATIERSSGRAIGSTRFGNIDRANPRVV